MERKYSVSIIDMVHYTLQIIGGQFVGALVFFIINSIASQIQYDQFMDSYYKNMEEFMTPGMKFFNMFVMFLGFFIVPLIFQALFVRTKASDQYENTDNPRRWLTKGLEYMVPGTLVCLIVSAIMLRSGIGFYLPLVLLSSYITMSGFAALCLSFALGILCFACHTAVLLAVYR
ncbi:MAG: hypothetical protein IJ037_00005, partial [Clostridia bacterium]|nr:hypothetical protein [Clostridia bacterium]